MKFFAIAAIALKEVVSAAAPVLTAIPVHTISFFLRLMHEKNYRRTFVRRLFSHPYDVQKPTAFAGTVENALGRVNCGARIREQYAGVAAIGKSVDARNRL